MLKKTIKFKDLEGNDHEKDFYFHLKKDLLVELEIVNEGGFKNHLMGIIASQNGRAIMDAFKEIIAMSYGEKSSDGLSFLQSKERSEWFMGTDAYSNFFFELVTSATFASDFINGIMPSDLEQEAAKLEAEMKRNGLKVVPDDVTGAAAEASEEKPAMSDEDLAKVIDLVRSGKLQVPSEV